MRARITEAGIKVIHERTSVPRAADELKSPVTSGGMAAGRSLLAALVMDADGIKMGTRFVTTH